MSVRVEYFIDHLKVGGAQRHLVELLGGLDRRRFSPQICVAKGGGALEAEFAAMDVPVRSFGVGTSLARPAILARLASTARRLRAERVEIVHGYLYAGNLLGMLAGTLAGVPIRIASKRSLDRYPRASQRIATRFGNTLAHRIVCNAEAVRRVVLAEERPAAWRLTVVPNGIRVGTVAGRPAERPAGVNAGARLVGIVGRLGWKKAVHHFLDAAARVRAAHPDVEFVVIGDGPLRRELEATAERLGVAPAVHFVGERADVAGLIRSLDVFVMSSVIEGMPNALLEALALERPVVATGVGGIPEIIVDGRSGLIVPPSEPGALAAAIQRLLADPAEARALAAEGRRTVEARFDVTTMIARVGAMYEELAAERGRRGAVDAGARVVSG